MAVNVQGRVDAGECDEAAASGVYNESAKEGGVSGRGYSMLLGRVLMKGVLLTDSVALLCVVSAV